MANHLTDREKKLIHNIYRRNKQMQKIGPNEFLLEFNDWDVSELRQHFGWTNDRIQEELEKLEP